MALIITNQVQQGFALDLLLWMALVWWIAVAAWMLAGNPVPALPYNYATPSERLWMPFAEPGQPVDRVLLYYHKVEVVVPRYSQSRKD